MALNIYRRHRRDCKAGHPEEHLSSEFDERKKGWKRCECPIFVSGTLARLYRRRSTGKWEWEDAKIVIADLNTARSWTGEVTPKTEPLPEKPASCRKEIVQATAAFQTEFGEHGAVGTQKKYRLMLNKLKSFSEQRGYVMVDQWGPTGIRDFRSSWNVSAQTAPRRMSMVRAFFEYCHANEWIERNPARLVKNPKSRDASDRRGEQKLPFTDDEIKKMYEACPKYGNTYRHVWKGEDLADFISLSVYTGLRISDVALFHIDRMQETGEILIRTTKAGTHVYTWVPPWLQDRIKARAKEIGPFIFGAHQTKSLDVITDLWRRKLKKLWELCGSWKVQPTPHRFRHTFARIVLQRGVSVRDVADLLGNSEQMIRKHYAAWIPERQQRLTQILKDAFADKPTPRLVAMPGRSG